eukprot:TRINITY_DN1933_c2_g1_i3.p2 TRINITY_DN1933_c2_g1~~TRINITY_DN1933_c2_g1_i3.p2  ORF type:complete len:103 (+),score=13.15 TRINITY_DN1933_c2_g1_i3:187-495(+)
MQITMKRSCGKISFEVKELPSVCNASINSTDSKPNITNCVLVLQRTEHNQESDLRGFDDFKLHSVDSILLMSYGSSGIWDRETNHEQTRKFIQTVSNTLNFP